LGCCAVGAEADDDRISFLLRELEGKDILEVIASGKEKFASVPSGGGGGGVVVSSGGGGVPAAAAAEEKKEEKKEEEAKEESDDVSVFFMFYVEGFICSILVFFATFTTVLCITSVAKQQQ
jgi:large subunit ribosomal protein LP2